jgi:hypothetical protein
MELMTNHILSTDFGSTARHGHQMRNPNATKKLSSTTKVPYAPATAFAFHDDFWSW